MTPPQAVPVVPSAATPRLGDRIGRGVHFVAEAKIATPLGPMFALADAQALRVLDFQDRRGLDAHVARVRFSLSSGAARAASAGPRASGAEEVLLATRELVGAFFARRWSVLNAQPCGEPCAPHAWLIGPLGSDSRVMIEPPRATPFMRWAWAGLLAIPAGQTRSYAQQASAIGQPAAARAVARANAMNFISILIPCHRVIGADGSLTGYGGGVARKRSLLEHEQSRSIPKDDQLGLFAPEP